MAQNIVVDRAEAIARHFAAKKPRKRRVKRVLSDWFVVRVKSGQERRARRYLEKAGRRVFIPWLCDEGSVLEKPLFPGYIFVHGLEWYHVKSTPGCLTPLMCGEGPSYVPIREMKLLQGAGDKEGVITIPKERFEEGQPIRSKRGAFNELWGVYKGLTAAGRVRALYKIFGREFVLDFPASGVTAFPHDSDAETEVIAAMQAPPVRSPSKKRK